MSGFCLLLNTVRIFTTKVNEIMDVWRTLYFLNILLKTPCYLIPKDKGYHNIYGYKDNDETTGCFSVYTNFCGSCPKTCLLNESSTYCLLVVCLRLGINGRLYNLEKRFSVF